MTTATDYAATAGLLPMLDASSGPLQRALDALHPGDLGEEPSDG